MHLAFETQTHIISLSQCSDKGSDKMVQFSSVAQSCLTLRPQESQHARPPCLSQMVEVDKYQINS